MALSSVSFALCGLVALWFGLAHAQDTADCYFNQQQFTMPSRFYFSCSATTSLLHPFLRLGNFQYTTGILIKEKKQCTCTAGLYQGSDCIQQPPTPTSAPLQALTCQSAECDLDSASLIQPVAGAPLCFSVACNQDQTCVGDRMIISFQMWYDLSTAIALSSAAFVVFAVALALLLWLWHRGTPRTQTQTQAHNTRTEPLLGADSQFGHSDVPLSPGQSQSDSTTTTPNNNTMRTWRNMMKALHMSDPVLGFIYVAPHDPYSRFWRLLTFLFVLMFQWTLSYMPSFSPPQSIKEAATAQITAIIGSAIMFLFFFFPYESLFVMATRGRQNKEDHPFLCRVTGIYTVQEACVGTDKRRALLCFGLVCTMPALILAGVVIPRIANSPERTAICLVLAQGFATGTLLSWLKGAVLFALSPKDAVDAYDRYWRRYSVPYQPAVV